MIWLSTGGEMLVNKMDYLEGKSTKGIQLLRALSSLSLGFLAMCIFIRVAAVFFFCFFSDVSHVLYF